MKAIPLPETLLEDDPRKRARALYWQGWRIARIAELLGLPEATVHSWKRRDEWDNASPIERVDAALETRLITLINKAQKEGIDFKEIDLLGRQLERTARVKKFLDGGNEKDLNPKIANRHTGRKKAEDNSFDEEAKAKIQSAFWDSLFDYQKHWHAAGKEHRIRNILKSRQIGATWYFAREALADAIETGRNQIFLSASKAQSHVFKEYIAAFAKEAAGEELRGNPIVLDNGATLYFLSTNARTAQSYHGNLYFDEYFWVQKFPELNKVASGMAMHKQWRKTYFSTPSTIAHGAYPFWTGEAWGKGRKDKTIIDVSHGALKSGRLCADGQWRQIITVEDAAVLGCDLFDLAQLKLEYGASEYANLLLCQFVDDTASVFPFALLQRAMVDSWDAWQTDFSPLILRPFGNREVWIGYDPAHSGDCSGLAVVAPPLTASGKFRVLEKAQFKGLDFEAQAKAIRNLCARYNVAYIGIDATGVGQGVLQLVRSFYPSVTEIRYSQDSKTRMVLKGLDTFAKGRIEFDAGWADMAQSFMAIRQTSTDSGRGMTFKASRSAEISHADLAWAVLHALANEPLEGQTQTNGGFLEIFD